ncbi:hypothetical protein F5B21DRAFT_500362 [Xylaria acuta]|nr:hypothetical protein F5B21DRAFT_500362 [Xylaria acuta]
MRLINVETLSLEEFMIVKPETLEYAVLSHTWGDGEITFRDFTGFDSYRGNQKGFYKIVRTCELARRDGIRYVGIGTCCIDKTSSAELTEAINYMAYCLIGIFEVNMPMLYGKGERALLRLQEEIVKDTNDPSIFAWGRSRRARNTTASSQEARPNSAITVQ